MKDNGGPVGGFGEWTTEPYESGPWPDWLPWGYGFPCGLARECLRRLLPGSRPRRVLDARCGSGAAAAQAMLLGHEVWACEQHPLGLLATRARARALEMDPRRLENLLTAFLRFGTRLSVRPPAPARRGLWPLQLRRQALAVSDFVDVWENEDREAADLLRILLAAALAEAADRPQPLRRIRPSLRARRRQSGLVGLLARRLGHMVEDLKNLRPQVTSRPPLTVHFFSERFPARRLPASAFDLILLAMQSADLSPSRMGQLTPGAEPEGLRRSRLAGLRDAQSDRPQPAEEEVADLLLTGSMDLPLLDQDLLPPRAELGCSCSPPAGPSAVLQGLRRCLRKEGWTVLWFSHGGETVQSLMAAAAIHGLQVEHQPRPGLLLCRVL